MTAALGVATGGAPRDSAWADAGYVKALNPDYVAAVKTQMQHTRATSVFRQGWNDVVLLIVDSIHQIYQGTSPEDAVALKPGDIVVAASDGILTLTHKALEELLAFGRHTTADKIADAVLFAIRRINHERQDNTTVGVIKIS